jgi:hypothetical protein
VAPRPDPPIKVVFEDADAALGNLDFGRASSFRKQSFKRAANNTRSGGCLIETENLHECDSVSLRVALWPNLTGNAGVPDFSSAQPSELYRRLVQAAAEPLPDNGAFR